MRVAETLGHEALPPQREQVARDGVVEREQRREHRRREQQRHHLRRRPTEVRAAEFEQERRRVGLEAAQMRDERARTLAAHHEPRRDRVEDADDEHGEVGGARHRAARVPRLLGVDRRRLEADVAGRVEQQGDGERAARQGAPTERLHGQVGAETACATLAALDDDGQIEGEHDEELQRHQHAQHLDRQVHLPEPENADDGPGDEGAGPPRRIDPEVLGAEARRRGAEQAVETDLHGVVPQESDPRCGAACRLTQAAGDVRVERAGARVVARHGRVADAEQQQHRADDEVGERDTRAVAQQHGDGRTTGHRRQWRGSRDHEERDGDGAEAAAAQVMHLLVAGGASRMRVTG